ncbi:MAG: dihydrolipoyl dehydrogenase [Actinobacteria bacterium]|nr:MAG: dihydrolipoyl dehydrogenase [Actinomycetota bacterium]
MADYDLLIIGGGPGGYSAALRAAQHGLKVAIVEKGKLGGTCLHRGCIPTKALIEASSVYSKVSNSKLFGIEHSGLSFNWRSISKYKSKVVSELYSALSSLIKARKIELINGSARFVTSAEITVGNKNVTAQNFVIAVGAKPKAIRAAPKSDLILDSDGLLELKYAPKTLTIIGGGYIGVEFASLFNEFGADINIIEVAPDILMNHDSQIRDSLKEKLLERDIGIKTETEVISVEEKDGKVEVKARSKAANLSFESELLLIAVGRDANTQNLDLDEAGVKLQEGFVDVDSYLKTSVDNIYAVGDCINTPQLAHVAFAEGMAVADFIATGEATFPYYPAVPSVVYSRPEVASVGETEDSAIAAGMKVNTTHYSFMNNSKAVIERRQEGLVKIVADTSDNVLGIHIVGSDASNLIAEAMLSVGFEAKVGDIAKFIHPHPTLTEAIGEAALKLSGRPLHSM